MASSIVEALQHAAEIKLAALDIVKAQLLDAKIQSGNLREITGVSNAFEATPEEIELLKSIFHQDGELTACPLCMWLERSYKRYMR